LVTLECKFDILLYENIEIQLSLVDLESLVEVELPIDVSADIMEVKPFEMKFGDFTVLAEYISKKGSKRFLFSAFVELF
jgi:hypothetical protein